MSISKTTLLLILAASGMAAGGCGSSNSPLTPVSPPPPPPAATVDVTGVIVDGEVEGGTLFAFAAAEINAAFSAAADAEDRAAVLAAATPIVNFSRDPADGSSFSLAIPGEHADLPLFLIFDAAGSQDIEFADEPFNMESAFVAGAAGTQMTVNVTPHTTLTSIQVRALLDPDGDGVNIDDASIAAAIETALGNSIAAFGTAQLGGELFPSGEDPHSMTAVDVLESASAEVGLRVRSAALASGITYNETIALFAADIADGTLDAIPSMNFNLGADETETLQTAVAFQALGDATLTDVVSVNCSSSANSLRRACEFEALDEFFIGVAICAHNDNEEDAATCLAQFSDDRDDLLDECTAITEARLDLCVATNDAPYDAAFGPSFATNFVDPLSIGNTEPPNPYFPMVQGAEWVYEGTFEEDGETVTEVITITVTDRVKLVDGIRCLVVRDVVEIDGELIEDTDDWFAQDTDGNVWYCGEEVKDYETFDGDVPAIPELIAIDGSFKAGRDGDEAGIQLPFAPVVGDLFRQEVSFTNAEDAIEILDIEASVTVPAVSCSGDCLLTRDFSPLDPGVEEHKYYAPGIGKILEVDLETGERVELISSTLLP